MNALLRQWPIALGALLATTATSVAQEFRSGDGLLQLRAAFPEEVRVGEQFTYTIEVQNTSDNVVLHDIRLEQKKADGLSIEGTSQGSQSRKSGQSGRSASPQQEQANQQQKQANPQQEQASRQQQQNQNQMVIDMLMPGESRMINVKASADEQGELQSCLEVVSYKPALCLTARAVKPELEITKQAPERAGRCELIELIYTVKNSGSGDVEAFEVVDELGDGLQTIEGEQTLKFQVDGLTAGDTRQFLARVIATRAGTFGSRAVAQATRTDLKSRSQRTETEIVAADLTVQLDGPGRLYGNQLAQFHARVTNTGNVPAENVQVQVRWPQGAALADLSDPRLSKQSAQRESQNSYATPTLADVQVDQPNSQSQQNPNGTDSNEQKVAMDDRAFSIARLDPGQTATFNYALRPGQLEKLPSEVKATYVCVIDEAQDTAEARSESTAMAHATTTIVRLPALQLIVLDDEDPVPSNAQVTYSIRIWNEGDADDQQVELSTELPEGLKFEDAQGPTEHQVDGSNITFQPIETLRAGAHVDYKITATSQGQGSVRFIAKLNSQSLEGEVVGEEPTRLFDGRASN